VRRRAAPIELGNETILIVEDDSMVWKFVTAQNREPRLWDTVGSQCPATRWALIDKRCPVSTLLFTDVMMPGLMNGRQLADENFKGAALLCEYFFTFRLYGKKRDDFTTAGSIPPAPFHLLGKTLPQIRIGSDDSRRVGLGAENPCGGLELGRSGRFEFGLSRKNRRLQAFTRPGWCPAGRRFATSTRALRPRR